MARKPKETKVVHRRLGKHKAVGLAHFDANKIELDERLSGYRYINVLLHEKLHLLHPDWSEKKVNAEAHQLTKFLWSNNIRWVDLSYK